MPERKGGPVSSPLSHIGRGLYPRTFSQVECVQREGKVPAVRVEVAVDARLRAVLRVVRQANERVEIPVLLCHLESSHNLVVRDYFGRIESATFANRE